MICSYRTKKRCRRIDQGQSTPTMYLDKLDPHHFSACEDEASARQFFKRVVRLVEIEVFSYCNRVCWFCPNRDGARLGENRYMSEALYSSIISQLASIDYSGKISYSRYNEPLADRVILRRLQEARLALPHAALHTNTNGDFVTLQYLRELHTAGLQSLNIQIYLKNNEIYHHEAMRAKAEMICGKLGLPYSLTMDDPDNWLEYDIRFPGLAIRLYGRNFARNGTSRGDTVDIARDYVRISPCTMPFWTLYIDFNGAMMPCCNLRSDIPAHKQAIVAMLTEHSSMFQHFASAMLARWRRSLMSFKEKQGLCRSCRFALEKDDPHTREVVRAAQLTVEGA